MFDHNFQPIKSKANKFNYRAFKQYLSKIDQAQADKFLETNPGWTLHVMAKLCYVKIFQFIDRLQFMDNLTIMNTSQNQGQINHQINFDQSLDEDLLAVKQIFLTLEIDYQTQFSQFISEQVNKENLVFYRGFQSLYFDFLNKTNLPQAIQFLDKKLNLQQKSKVFQQNLLKKGKNEFQPLLLMMIE